MKNTILIIEDDTSVNKMLSKLLQQNGYNTISAYSGTEGVLVHNDSVDLIILDIMLPGKNGDEIIEELKQKKEVPIIISSAKVDVDSKVKALMMGADDYITKPFSNEELLARIAVRLRNFEGNNKNCWNICNNEKARLIEYKDIIIGADDFSAKCNGIEMDLSKHEFMLLKLLVENYNRTCTKSMIYDCVWNYDESVDDNTLNVHISKLRKKLRQCNPDIDYIETVWGIGYRMRK